MSHRVLVDSYDVASPVSHVDLAMTGDYVGYELEIWKLQCPTVAGVGFLFSRDVGATFPQDLTNYDSYRSNARGMHDDIDGKKWSGSPFSDAQGYLISNPRTRGRVNAFIDPAEDGHNATLTLFNNYWVPTDNKAWVELATSVFVEETGRVNKIRIADYNFLDSGIGQNIASGVFRLWGIQ